MKFERLKKIDFNRKVGNLIKIVGNHNKLLDDKEYAETRYINISYKGHVYQVMITVGEIESNVPSEFDLIE
jgi:hypothetical protein